MMVNETGIVLKLEGFNHKLPVSHKIFAKLTVTEYSLNSSVLDIRPQRCQRYQLSVHYCFLVGTISYVVNKNWRTWLHNLMKLNREFGRIRKFYFFL